MHENEAKIDKIADKIGRDQAKYEEVAEQRPWSMDKYEVM